MAIATWPAGLEARVMAVLAAASQEDSATHGPRALIAAKELPGSASEIQALSNEGLTAITALSVVITTAARRACKATMAFPAWEQGALSAAAEERAVADSAVVEGRVVVAEG